MVVVDTHFKINNDSKIASFISWRNFRSDRDFIEQVYHYIKEEYPTIYTENDSEWNWKTLDFWPKWVDVNELISHLRS